MDNIKQHQFVCLDDNNPKPKVHQWLRQNIPEANIIFTSNEMSVLNDTVVAGLGIGAMTVDEGRKWDLVNIAPSISDQHTSKWQVTNWLVTHVDLHRSEKVQRFLKIVQSEQ